jgi:hypothetical protein
VYDSTWAPAVQVNDAGFNKAEAKARAEVTAFQIALQGSRIRARVAAGTMTNAAGDTALQELNQQAEAISNQVTTDLVDTLLVRDLAAANEVTADPAVTASEWAKETTLPELRLFRRISIDAAKFHADGKGVETPARLDDMIDVGLFRSKPGQGAFSRKDVLVMQRLPVKSGRQTLVLISDEKPAVAGVDPYAKYVDRNADDNLVDVS